MMGTPELQHIDPAAGAEPSAQDLLIEAADCIGERASQRDQPSGERSMARAVEMFNAWRGGDGADCGHLSEREGWVFMALLKLARAAGGGHRKDDYVDGAAYIALAGECAERQHR